MAGLRADVTAGRCRAGLAAASRCVVERLLHLGVYAVQTLRRTWWFFLRPRTVGVHGIPLTPDGKIVLVTLSYATGWRLPGGGLRAAEEPSEGVLRELREEIGLMAHTSIEPVCNFSHQPDFQQGDATLFVIRGVRYRRRRWSLEVKDVAEFDLCALPVETAEITRKLLDLAGSKLA